VIIHRSTTLLSLAFFLAAPLMGQQPAAPAAPPDHVTAIKQSLQKSAASIRAYQWVETTTVTMKGEVKSQTQASCYYGADGKVQKMPVAAPAAEEKKRGLRGKIVENKKEEISASMKEAVALVHQYIPPDPARIQAAKDSGRLTLTPPDPKGNVVVVIKDYLKPGDSLTINLNTAAGLLTGLAVSTFTDAKEAVGLKVTMSALPDGTVYAAQTNLDVTSQKMTVKIENSGYRKVGG
jgi:hypothetical protein